MDKDFVNELRKVFEKFSARDMAMIDARIVIMPHRINDGNDNEEAWCFKVQSYDRDGSLIDTKLL